MIPGFFDPRRARPAPSAGQILLPELAEKWFEVDFLLDTGASRSCLHPSDAIAGAGIRRAALADPARWRQHEPPRGVGGESIYYVTLATYAFVTDAGEAQVVDGHIRIGQLRPGSLGLPSLLGWDVLQFEIVVDWQSKRIELR